MSDLELSDHTDLAKVLIRADPGGIVGSALGVPYGKVNRAADGALVVGTAPDAWLLLVPADSAGSVVQRTEALADGEFASVIDVTHGHTVLRLTGRAAANALGTICAIDLSGVATPDGTAVRTLIAGITATVIRDDAAGERSYLALCERSYGQYLVEVLTDAGQEFAIVRATDGAAGPG